MTRNVVGPLEMINSTMDSKQYMRILERRLLPFASKTLPQRWLYYQDNSPVHTSRLMMGSVVRLSNGGRVRFPGWFAINGVSLIKTPPFSPDLNVIENLWSIVKTKLREKHFTSKIELWYYLRLVWNQIGSSVLHDLVDSMPRRIKKAIRVKGGSIDY